MLYIRKKIYIKSAPISGISVRFFALKMMLFEVL